MTPSGPTAPTENLPGSDRRAQWGWSFYDWAISGYSTVVVAVFLGPYLTRMATESACPVALTGEPAVCPIEGVTISVLGLPVDPGAFYGYLLAFSIVIQVIILPITGALADSVRSKKKILAVLAYLGAAATLAMFFITEHTWLMGAGLYLIAQASFGASMVVYNSYLPEIAAADERDGLSARGWALGYVGGGVLLALNLALLTYAEQLGISGQTAVRLGLLSAGIWWALFALIPLLTLRDPGRAVTKSTGEALRSSVGQLRETIRHIRQYPQTLRFLIAYLVYNDGVQSVIGLAAVYGVSELGLLEANIIVAFLLVQFVAFVGAVVIARVARSYGAQRVVMATLVFWALVLVAAFFVEKGSVPQFLALSVAIGLVLGGTQALSRSMFSQLIPEGKEAEYFSLYEISERGTSWLGAVTFSVMYSLTDSYRYAIVALIIFFVAGFLLLSSVKMRQGIADAGNEQPAVV